MSLDCCVRKILTLSEVQNMSREETDNEVDENYERLLNNPNRIVAVPKFWRYGIHKQGDKPITFREYAEQRKD